MKKHTKKDRTEELPPNKEMSEAEMIVHDVEVEVNSVEVASYDEYDDYGDEYQEELDDAEETFSVEHIPRGILR